MFNRYPRTEDNITAQINYLYAMWLVLVSQWIEVEERKKDASESLDSCILSLLLHAGTFPALIDLHPSTTVTQWKEAMSRDSQGASHVASALI